MGRRDESFRGAIRLTRAKGAVGTASVGSFPSGASPRGVLDMVGNVCQWCDNWYDADKKYKALRGRSWFYDFYDSAVGFRCADRVRDSPSGRFDYGFRWVVSTGLP